MSAICVDTPAVEVTHDLVSTLIEAGGYTHPLFRPGPEADPAAPLPLPGQAILLLAGGLVEQSGALDDAVALLELRSVSFHRMVTAGDSLRVRLTPGASRPTRDGRVVQELGWSIVAGAGEPVAEAVAVMLMTAPVTGEGEG